MDRRNFLRGAFALAALGSNPIFSLSKAFAATANTAPFLDPWIGAHNGFPRFDLVKVTDLKSALLKGMDLKKGEIEKIAGQKADPDFENTICALEDSGRSLDRCTRFFDIYTST
ncbi:MAG TPA: M3 family peptidase, partial [Candidatus Melainabacteria bacterium]|nr:M3 family peptidase [Candidatus Melainabacteria bacterium]